MTEGGGPPAGQRRSVERTTTTERQRTRVVHGTRPGEVPWDVLGADIIIEATGQFRTRRVLERHLEAGAKGVVLSTPPVGDIDHIEFFAAPRGAGAHSRNFVLCPGGAYDRSPCGTGTSAKLACLADDGLLAPGSEWVQESVIGSRFAASYRNGDDGRIIPRITGRAFICAEATLVCQPGDPFAEGIS